MRCPDKALRLGFSATLVVLLWGANVAAQAQCSDYAAGLHWVGYANRLGSPDDMVVVDAVLYAAWGTGFAAFDISNPDQPTLVGSVGCPGWSYGISVAGSHAYVASSGGLHVIDISTLSAPVLVASIWTFGRDARDIAVGGSYAYLADGSSGISVFDISNPAAPRLVKGFDPPGLAEGLAYRNSTLFVASGDRGLCVLGLQDPTTRRFLTSIDTPGAAQEVALAGDYAYVADGSGGLQIVDVADAAHPTMIATVDAAVLGNVTGVDVEGTLAYVASGDGVTVLDVANPADPRVVTRAKGSAVCVTVVGSKAYVGEGVTLDVFAFSGGETAPNDMGAGLALGEISDVAGSGSLALVTEYSDYDDGDLVHMGGLRIVDVTDRARPRLVGSLDVTDGLGCLAVSGAEVFAMSGSGTLRIIDISAPTSPAVVASVGMGSISAVAASGSTVYAGGFETGLRVIDVSDPGSPVIVGSLESLRQIRGLAVSGSHVYVIDGGSGFVVVDGSDPATPTIQGSLNDAWARGGRDIAVAGSHVYVSTYIEGWDRSRGDGLWVIDVADPGAPVVAGHVPCLPGDLALDAAHAYVATPWGIVLIDISVPAAPGIVGGTSRWGHSSRVAVHGSAVYVAAFDSLHVLPAPCEATPVALFDLAAEAHHDGILVHWRAIGSEFTHFDVLRSGRSGDSTLGHAARRGDVWELWDPSAEPGATYSYRVRGSRRDGSAVFFGPVVASALAPDDFALGPVRPFPARDNATINFTVSRAEVVRLEIYDVRGRRVRRLIDAPRGPGRHAVAWDGRGDAGDLVGSGVYFVRMRSSSAARTTRAAILR